MQKQKAGSNVAHQERSLDFSIQSPACSSSKDTTGHKEVRSDQQPLESPPLADDNVEDSDRGQQLLVGPSTDGLADVLPNLDLSFLPQFGQPVAAKTSPDLLSPSLSPADEIISPFTPTDLDFMISIYDPSTGRTQDSSPFDIVCNATPTSVHVSSLAPTAFSSQDSSGQSCQCLTAVVFAVEEFEGNGNSVNRAELDSIVAYQKEAIKCCRSMLRCSCCTAKRENLVLLVFMTERIVTGCGRIVALYRMKDAATRASSVPPSMLGCLPTNRFLHRANIKDGDLATTTSSSSSKTEYTPSVWRELFLGDYKISSSLEWEHLVRVLISLQLKAVMELLADMKNMGSTVLGETQRASLAQAERRVGELENEIYSI
ncbi:MAG: hypothetical protein Q9178_006712 [Gyalolechia marmorata]